MMGFTTDLWCTMTSEIIRTREENSLANDKRAKKNSPEMGKQIWWLDI